MKQFLTGLFCLFSCVLCLLAIVCYKNEEQNKKQKIDIGDANHVEQSLDNISCYNSQITLIDSGSQTLEASKNNNNFSSSTASESSFNETDKQLSECQITSIQLLKNPTNCNIVKGKIIDNDCLITLIKGAEFKVLSDNKLVSIDNNFLEIDFDNDSTSIIANTIGELFVKLKIKDEFLLSTNEALRENLVLNVKFNVIYPFVSKTFYFINQNNIDEKLIDRQIEFVSNSKLKFYCESFGLIECDYQVTENNDFDIIFRCNNQNNFSYSFNSQTTVFLDNDNLQNKYFELNSGNIVIDSEIFYPTQTKIKKFIVDKENLKLSNCQIDYLNQYGNVYFKNETARQNLVSENTILQNTTVYCKFETQNYTNSPFILEYYYAGTETVDSLYITISSTSIETSLGVVYYKATEIDVGYIITLQGGDEIQFNSADNTLNMNDDFYNSAPNNQTFVILNYIEDIRLSESQRLNAKTYDKTIVFIDKFTKFNKTHLLCGNVVKFDVNNYDNGVIEKSIILHYSSVEVEWFAFDGELYGNYTKNVKFNADFYGKFKINGIETDFNYRIIDLIISTDTSNVESSICSVEININESSFYVTITNQNNAQNSILEITNETYFGTYKLNDSDYYIGMSFVGHFVEENNDSFELTFFSNGTYSIFLSGVEFTFSYEIKTNTVNNYVLNLYECETGQVERQISAVATYNSNRVVIVYNSNSYFNSYSTQTYIRM